MKTRSLFGLLLLTLTGCADTKDFQFELVNHSGRKLDFFPVVTSPPPPHREHDATGDVPPDQQRTIDHTGFNPVYTNTFYQGNEPNGVIVQFDIDSPDPVVLVRLFRYETDPGTEGNDPTLQPTHVNDTVHFVTPGTWFIDVAIDWTITFSETPP